MLVWTFFSSQQMISKRTLHYSVLYSFVVLLITTLLVCFFLYILSNNPWRIWKWEKSEPFTEILHRMVYLEVNAR